MRLLLLVALIVIVGCTPVTGPTTVEDLTHPNEVKIFEYTQCYADFAGRTEYGPYTVIITDKARMYPCPPPHEGECPAMGWAFPQSTHVNYWGPWVRGEYNGSRTDWDLSIVAAHEVGHTTGLWDETKAELWAINAYLTSDCN